MKLRQATAVALDGRAVLIEGPPGCGKSTLALSLIDRGGVLVGDDGVALEVLPDRLRLHPPPATAGLLEVRNLGLVRFPCAAARACLVLSVEAGAPRFIEQATMIQIEGVTIPSLAMALGGPSDGLRVEHALRLYGLPA